MNFSVVIIAKNESKTLPRLTDSLKEFKNRGGDCILVDTGSSDGTPDVARALGWRVTEVGDKYIKTITPKIAESINNKFKTEIVKPGQRIFDYSSARNFAASLAKTDMVAMPDCDEAYTALDLDRVQEEIKNGAGQLEYHFVFSHDEFGNPMIQFAHSKFYNRKKMKWVGLIHEILAAKGEHKLVPLNKEVILLEHYQNEETDRSGYLPGLALDCYLRPKNDRNSHYFGRELMYKGKFEAAIKELSRHVKMDKWAAEKAQSLIFIGDCLQSLKNEHEAIRYYLEATVIDPSRREAYIRLADFYYKKSDHFRTMLYAEQATRIPYQPFYTNITTDYTYTPHEYLYWAYWYLGAKEESKKHYDKAYEFNPKRDKILQDRHIFYPPTE